MYRNGTAAGHDEPRLSEVLGRLVEIVPELPIPRIPDALGELERLRTALWARLLHGRPAPPSVPSDGERLLGVVAAAQLLGISKTALRRLEANGDLVSVRIGRRVLFRHESLLRFAEQRERSEGS